MPPIVSLIGLVVCLFMCAQEPVVVAAEGQIEVVNRTPHRDAGSGRGPVTIKLLPRSQWDPEQTYHAARIVATRAIRVCTHTNPGTGECTRERDAWSTAVSRDPYTSGPWEREKQKYHVYVPHPYELYRTYDNVTYEEVCARADGPTLEPEDYQLLEQTRKLAWRTSNKRVLRWGAGQLWTVPMVHWNAGERALHTGSGLHTVWLEQSPEQADERPLYMP